VKFTKKDLLESLKLKIGDRIVVHFKYSPREYLTVREDLMLEFDNGNTVSLISLVDSNYEKVKEYKRIVLASAVNRLSCNEKIFIKIKNRYNPIKYIEVSKGLAEVGYNDCEDCCFEILKSPHKRINNLAFYKEA